MTEDATPYGQQIKIRVDILVFRAYTGINSTFTKFIHGRRERGSFISKPPIHKTREEILI